jgi:predicted amidohydrolase
MVERFLAACIQNSAEVELAPSLDAAEDLTRAAAAAGARLVLLPEYFASLDVIDDLLVSRARPEAGHPALVRFQGLAAELSVWLLLGSLGIESPGSSSVGGSGRMLNRSYLIDATGAIAARYDKIHLFDVRLPNGEDYTESKSVVAGGEAVLAPTPWGPLGLTICYDLRFPQLYQALARAGARFLAVPAAFTKTTGEAHWHTLVRARAIETGSYVLAPCQTGTHAGGRASYGHSLIVDPWGKVLADGGTEVGFVIAQLDAEEVVRARLRIPALRHARHFDPPAPLGLQEAGE